MSDENERAYCNPEAAHPRAVELMSEDQFWNSIDDRTPFGSDESWEAYNSWCEWRESNPDASLNECFAWILDGKLHHYNDERASDHQIRLDRKNPSSDPWSDSWDMWTLDITIIATGLSQLLDEGKIDSEAKPYMRVAIKRQRSSEIEIPGLHPSKVLDAIARVVDLA